MKDKIKMAKQLAMIAHKDQKRDDGKPYYTHPFMVADLIQKVSKDEDLICAAYLHDVIEDNRNYKYSTIKEGFGKRIADIVREATKDKKGLFHIKTREGALIKLADTLHNLADADKIKKSSLIKRKIRFIAAAINMKSDAEVAKEMLEFYEEHNI